MLEWIAQYWLEAMLTATFSALITFIVQTFRREKAMRLGLQALLRNSILSLGKECRAKKSKTEEELGSMCAMYEQYHNLGGNGKITQLFEEFKELKTT